MICSSRFKKAIRFHFSVCLFWIQIIIFFLWIKLFLNKNSLQFSFSKNWSLIIRISWLIFFPLDIKFLVFLWHIYSKENWESSVFLSELNLDKLFFRVFWKSKKPSFKEEKRRTFLMRDSGIIFSGFSWLSLFSIF